MGLHQLKSFRVGVSVMFFVLTAFLFLDFRNIVEPSVAGGLLYLQFVPSLLKFANAAALGAAGFMVIMILTVLFGRVYCSTVCPLGTLQDVISFVAGKKSKWRDFRFSTPHNALRYSILTLTVLFLIAGSGFLLNLLDPFSNFGRIFSNLFRPVVLVVNNLAAIVLEGLDVHTLYRVQWAVFAPVSAIVSLAILMLIAWLAATRGRFYCNTVCPVGALLGLLSKISFLQISIDSGVCKGCQLCEGVCKAGCIDSRKKTVDISRCVGCYNCFAICPRKGLRFENRWRKRATAAQPDRERRDFIINSGVYLLGLTGFTEETKQIIQSRPTTIFGLVTSPISPPGSASIEHFTGTCTACHLCVSACPSRVLVPSFLEFGFLGIMQPRMNFQSGHCNYDCTICMEVCPSDAILPLTVEKKKLTQLGVAKFIKENCVVYTDNKDCGACSEHCPTKAVDMVPYPNPTNKRLVIPEVKPEYCIGCGGCEHACPTKPYKAIYVDGNPVHKLAKKPVVKKIEKKVDDNADFPF
ncbi:MAG: 4Fe-4S binding protein [Deltaproteobacteria bacterium]|nr:4Fe-4S binding protein [Deltaproteobacteria bacterium]